MKTSASLAIVLALLTFLAPPSTCAQAPAAVPPAQFALAIQNIGVEAIRAKQTRIAGGDFDDKHERITFNVKLTNPDAKIPLSDLKAEFYVFAQKL